MQHAMKFALSVLLILAALCFIIWLLRMIMISMGFGRRYTDGYVEAYQNWVDSKGNPMHKSRYERFTEIAINGPVGELPPGYFLWYSIGLCLIWGVGLIIVYWLNAPLFFSISLIVIGFLLAIFALMLIGGLDYSTLRILFLIMVGLVICGVGILLCLRYYNYVLWIDRLTA